MPCARQPELQNRVQTIRAGTGVGISTSVGASNNRQLFHDNPASGALLLLASHTSTGRGHQPRLRVVHAVDALEAGERERLRTHRDQHRIVERRELLGADDPDQADEPCDADVPSATPRRRAARRAGRRQPAGGCTIRAWGEGARDSAGARPGTACHIPYICTVLYRFPATDFPTMHRSDTLTDAKRRQWRKVQATSSAR